MNGMGFPGGLDAKKPPAKAEDGSLTPGSRRAPEKQMATNYSILAWKIPWTEEPGNLQSMESQRVGHDLVTKQQQQKILGT